MILVLALQGWLLHGWTDDNASVRGRTALARMLEWCLILAGHVWIPLRNILRDFSEIERL